MPRLIYRYSCNNEDFPRPILDVSTLLQSSYIIHSYDALKLLDSMKYLLYVFHKISFVVLIPLYTFNKKKILQKIFTIVLKLKIKILF